MGCFALEVVESGSARRRKYTKAAWCEAYSLARQWFERLEVSRLYSVRSQRDKREARESTEGRYRSIPSSITPYPRHDDKHTTEEKWVGVIADKGHVRSTKGCLVS